MSKKTLVLGASLKSSRYSNMAVNKLLSHGIETVAIGLRKGSINGVDIDTDKVSYDNIHTVTLYLNPKRQQEYYDYIVSLEPARVIFNPGTENPELYTLLRENGIDYEIACTLILLNVRSY